MRLLLPQFNRFVAVLFVLSLSRVAPALPIPGQDPHAKVSAELNTTALKPGSEAVVAVVLDVRQGFHSQSNTPRGEFDEAMEIKVDPAPGITLGGVQYPAGHDEKYAGGVEANVYTGRAVAYVPVKVATDAKEGPVKLSGTIKYQICDDKGVCFQPKTVPWSVETTVSAAGGEARAAELFKGYVPGAQAATRPAARGAKPPAVEGRPDWGIPLALGAAFVAGILFNIVPCVLPVLPIKVMGFAEVAQHDRAKTLGLSVVFGLGIVSVFAVLALFILVLKQFTWGQQFSNPWFAWGVVILLAVMAAWMFGWLNFNLPGGIYNFSPRHDTLIGNFEWGALTAVLSTPCTGPLFPPLMLWAQAQSLTLGVTAVMMVGVGMAFPYIILSLFPEVARRFPRVGPWAELFKQMMGFMLLGAAVFFAAGRFVTGASLYWTLVPVAIIAAVYLIVRTIQNGAGTRGVVVSCVLATLIFGLTTAWAATFVSPVKWEPYADDAIERARKTNIVLVKFTANWCLNCQYIERTVFHDKETAATLKRYGVVAVKADLTSKDAPGWPRLMKLSETGGIPLTAVYVPGQEEPIVLSGMYTKSTLVETIGRLGSEKVAAASR